MNYPVLVFWALIACSVVASPSVVLVLLLASIPFAGLSLIPSDFIGGVAILPQTAFAILLILKVIGPQLVPLSPRLLATLQLRHLGFLALFLLVGIVATVVTPRLFVGDMVIFPMRQAWKPDLLSPTLANFTQSSYVMLSVMVVFAVTLMVNGLGFARTLLTGILAGGAVCVVTGLIDFAAAAAGLQKLLEPFRNAEYAYLTSAGVGNLVGVRRVVGFTPEASAYGSICVEFAAALALLRTLYAEGARRFLATIVLVGLVVMALLSTSSTAYVGLAVLALAYAANWIRRAVFSSAVGQSGLMGELLAGLALAATLLFILIYRTDLLDPLFNAVQEVIFNKPLSDSFYERTSWNARAWDTFASTWGLGIGFGSTRTSNWFMAIVSGSGLIGSTLMAVFLIQTMARQPIWRTELATELLWGLKLTLLPVLIMICLGAGGPDFGPWIAVVFGAIAGIAALEPIRLRDSVGNKSLRLSVGRPIAKARALGSWVPSATGDRRI